MAPLKLAQSNLSRFLHYQRLKNHVERLLPRRFQVYCLGAAKTGTTTLASMFKKFYRASHEPDAMETNQLIIDWLEQSMSRTELKTKLIQRDHRLKLELESAHPLGYICDVLVETFPNAKFIITIREPYSWLKSRLNYYHKIGKLDAPGWKDYREYFYAKRHLGYAPEEIVLEKFGLFSLDTYLSSYAAHYNRVLNQIPQEKRLILKTADLNQSISLIANFVGVEQEKLELKHSNYNPDKIEPLKEINPKFVKDKIWQHCQELIEQYFPETASNYS